MALAAVDEALRNVVAVGGDPDRTAILDNFSWGNCDRPEQLGSLVLAAAALPRRGARLPDALHLRARTASTTSSGRGRRTIAIPPTLLISALAIVPDVRALRRWT